MTGNPMLTLLIVDDEPSIAIALSKLLTRRGYAAVFALNSVSATDILTTRHIDILVIDYRISDARGDILYAQAVALQPHLRTQTMFLTGDPSEEVQQAIRETGCQSLMKPFDISELEAALCTIVRTIGGDTNESIGAA
jgi:DNA-binding response OmpR family regulator